MCTYKGMCIHTWRMGNIRNVSLCVMVAIDAELNLALNKDIAPASWRQIAGQGHFIQDILKTDRKVTVTHLPSPWP